MFDFEKLEVYKIAKAFNKDVLALMRNTKTIDVITKNQLRRASLNMVLNIAEGTSRFSKPDKRNEEEFMQLYGKADELSRMLFGMIRNCQ